MEETTKHSDSPHSRIARYYLACLAADDDNGLSFFRRDDSPDYTVANARTLTEVLSKGFPSPSAGRSDHRQQFIGYLTFVGSPAGGPGSVRVEPILLFEVSDDGSVDPFPFINPAFIKRFAMGGDRDHLKDTLNLQTEIGLADPYTPPLITDVVRHLHEARPDWPWQEPPETDALGIGPFGRAAFGIYNRAINCSVGQSQFTRGLENELDALARKSPTEVADTALGAWVNGAPHCTNPETNPPDLLEPLPLNREQREAVQRALTERLTVITGPPGTGKSQVVTALLINAVVHGQRVLFASKNNKAVDVVEDRLNGFGSRPVLLRLGSDDHRQRLAEHLDALRGGRATADDLGAYKQQTEHHARLLEVLSENSQRLERTVALRNQTDRLERDADEARDTMASEEFAAVQGVSTEEMSALCAAGAAVQVALTRGDRAVAGVIVQLFWPLVGPSRIEALGASIEELRRALRAHSLAELPPLGSQDFLTLAAYARSALERLDAIARAHDYFSVLAELQEAFPLEFNARETLELRQQITANSIDLWRSWVRTQPSRLTEHDRRALGDFSAVLRLIVGANQASQPLRADVFSRYYRLFDQVSDFLPAWAVTALSARSRLPLAPGAFDLLVIDEASQCDIASALPLLYRCKRAVIIGDPMQLRHISAMPKALDLQKLQTHGLADGYLSWSYTAHSLYDLASSLTHAEGVVQLRDHHRSHPDIIGFSNRHFYESTLRIATKLNGLSPVWKDPPFVRWLDIAGRASRPSGGSLFNEAEARAVVDELRKLMQSSYSGSVGVVTPFREQANRIRRFLASDNALQEWANAHGCIMETVHRYQGDERDAIIFSPVISHGTPDSSLRFLGTNGHLFNVAITRARATLIVVGDKTAAKNSGVRYLVDFADYVDRANDSHAAAADLPAQALSMTSPCAGYPPVRNPHQVSEWECILYRALCASGLQPLPQYTVDRYDLDLALFAEGREGEERRLDIEVDGQRYHQDWDGELVRSDQLRNERLIELGWDVMRFWVYEVRDSLDDCVARVKAWTTGATPGR